MLYRRSFNLYHCILSDSRNSRTKFISHRVTERGRLFTVIVRRVLKFNNECVVDLIATLRLSYHSFLSDGHLSVRNIIKTQGYKPCMHIVNCFQSMGGCTHFISRYKSVIEKNYDLSFCFVSISTAI